MPLTNSRQLVAIMFTDMVGYTALMGKDEQRAFDLLTKNREIQKPVIEENNGRWIKELGDGILASFPTVSDAVNAAIRIQEKCNLSGDFLLRIGIHQGEVVFQEGDIFGDAVNIASRIQALAPPGGIWISESVNNNIVNKKGIDTQYVKEEKLKNVQQPVRIYEINLKSGLHSTFTPKHSSYNRSRQSRLYVSLGIGILLVLGFLLYNNFHTNIQDKKMPVETVTGKSIAVLPFVNMSNDKEQEYFSDGLSEELMNLLSKISELKVIGRTSSFSFKGKNEDLRVIGNKLGVDHILEGSVRKEKNMVKVTTQLIKVADGSRIWGETYHRDLESIFKLQEEIAQIVVRALEVKLSSPATSNNNNQNIEVHNLLLQGNFYINKLDRESVSKAHEFYQNALTIDSSNSHVWAKLSSVLARQSWQNYINQYDGYEKARRAAIKSIELDKTNTLGYAALAAVKIYHDFDWKGAESDLQKALAVDPNNADILNYLGVISQITGKWKTAIDYMERALAFDPLRPIFYSNQGANFTYSNKLDEAITMYKKVLELNPQFQRAHMYLARAYLMKGQPELALTEMEQENEKVFKDFGLSIVYHALNRTKEANDKFSEFISTYQNQWAYLIAEIYAFRGEKDKAFEWLEKAFERKDSWLVWVNRDPFLRNLEKDPRLALFLQKMQL